MRKFAIVLGLSAILLAACGGSSTSLRDAGTSSTSGTTGTTGTGTTTTTPTVVPASLTATSSVTSISSDGSTTATITVLARNSANDLISGVIVAFAADSGGVAVTNATTDATGASVATLSTAGDSLPRVITVSATSSGLTASVKVQVVATASATTTVVSSLTMTGSAASILNDGSTTATITALARDASNNVLAGVPIAFTASSGAIQAAASTTDATGKVTATLSTGGDSSMRTITVTGTTAKLTSTVQVQVLAPSSPTVPVYSMGNGSGTGFVANKLDLAVNDSTTPSSLAAGGSTGLLLTIVDQTGTLYIGGPGHRDFQFSVYCLRRISNPRVGKYDPRNYDHDQYRQCQCQLRRKWMCRLGCDPGQRNGRRREYFGERLGHRGRGARGLDPIRVRDPDHDRIERYGPC